ASAVPAGVDGPTTFARRPETTQTITTMISRMTKTSRPTPMPISTLLLGRQDAQARAPRCSLVFRGAGAVGRAGVLTGFGGGIAGMLMDEDDSRGRLTVAAARLVGGGVLVDEALGAGVSLACD